jgi:hypothetical protein
MSKIPPREPVELDARRGKSLGVELSVVRNYVVCAKCQLITGGSYHLDHVIPLALGGRDDWGNLQPLCVICHAGKTELDKKLIAKAKRLAGETCVAPSRTPLPFGKNSRWKRKLPTKAKPFGERVER